ncbi:MAG TPA: tripartite tricarboxylate transporter substrate-binding protein [Rhizomicrobium sp.]|nr:tripartite tricarboxylate transporter substrate-binding protein [Rhizomicrobium sp.]
MAVWIGSPGARGQDFPAHPIKIIVGPSPDVFSRIIAEDLKEAWGQPVVVEPRPGAGGKIAADDVLSAPADGYTLLFATPTYTLNTAMGLAPYDLTKDFTPVAMAGLISYALVVNPSVPAKSVAELVADAKQNPAKLNCASAGIGTVPHIACAYLNKVAGTDIVHVPFKDVNSGMMATVGNVTQMFFGVATNAKPQIETGALRGLAVSTPQRSLLLLQLPTMIEAGYPTFNMPGWGGFITRAGAPAAVIAKLNAEIRRAVQRPELKSRLLAAGLEPPPDYTPEELGTFIAQDITRWTSYVDTIGKEKLNAAEPK